MDPVGAPAASSRRLERLGVPLLFLAAALAVYGRTLSYPFVLDDQMAIVRNDFLKAPGNPLLFFVSDYSRGTTFGPGYFRPLMMFSLWLQGALLGWSPWHFHLVNVLLHAAAATALYGVARGLGCRPGGAAFGALLFAVHPAGREAVGSIVDRCDILAAWPYLLGWRAQLEWERGRRGAVSAAALVGSGGLLAMLGKISAITYPVVIALTALFFDRRVGVAPPGGRSARTVRVALGAAALGAAIVFILLRSIAVGALLPGPGREAVAAARGANPLFGLTQPERTWAALYGTGRLLLGMIWPARISAPLDLLPGHPFPLSGPLDPGVLLPAGVLALLGVAGLIGFARSRLAALPLLMMLLNLVPVSNLIVLTFTFVAERFVYLPFAGVALLAAIAWDAVDGRLGRRRAVVGPARRVAPASIAAAAAGALVVALGSVAALRVGDWESEEAVVRHWPEQYPWSVIGWNHLGTAALQRGDFEAARRSFERSVAIDPGNPVVLARLGAILLRQGRPEDALAHLRRAAELAPADASARVDLSRALLVLGRKDEALAAAREAWALAPASPGPGLALATALFDDGRFDEAAWQFGRLVAGNPRDLQMRQGLLLSLDRAGRPREAEAAAADASRHLPDEPLFDLWRARLAMRAGRRDEALDALEQARARGAPVDTWLEEVDDLRPLRSDPRAGVTR